MEHFKICHTSKEHVQNYLYWNGFLEQVIDRSGRDNKSHFHEHAETSGHENVSIGRFETLLNGYEKNQLKRKLEEALHIKHERPTLNIQKQSVLLKLLN